MRTLDFSPLFRHSVGFDRLEQILDTVKRYEDGASYPPYNIETVDEDHYRITLAVAGFGEADLDVTVTENMLVVTGNKAGESDDAQRYLHRGIAGRTFERRFQLADDIKVVGGSIENGLLNIALERIVPEHKKPRKIEIAAGATTESTANVIEDKKAA